MQLQKAAIQLVLISGVMLLVGCSTPIQCEGYPKAVCDRCGENPVEIRILKRMKATGISDLAAKDAKKCVNGYFDARLKDAEAAKLGLNACFERTATLDPAARDAIIRIIDDAVQNKDLSETLKVWEVCYRRQVAGAP